MAKNLKQLRNKIDQIDEKIIRLISKRFFYTQKVGELKAKENLDGEDLAREKKQFLRYEKLSKKLGIEKELSAKVFSEIIKTVKENHKIIKNEKK